MKITFGLVKVTLSLQGYIIWQALRIILLSTLGRKVESEVAQLCRTLCDLMDYSLLGSSVHEILQTRILEWVAISRLLIFQGKKYDNVFVGSSRDATLSLGSSKRSSDS